MVKIVESNDSLTYQAVLFPKGYTCIFCADMGVQRSYMYVSPKYICEKDTNYDKVDITLLSLSFPSFEFSTSCKETYKRWLEEIKNAGAVFYKIKYTWRDKHPKKGKRTIPKHFKPSPPGLGWHVYYNRYEKRYILNFMR